MRSTRTRSPYFSPNRAMAPAAMASSRVMTRVSTAMIAANFRVDQALDGRQLLRAHRLEVGEVEAQPLGVHQRAFLLDMIAQHLAQGRMHQVGRGVIERRGAAPIGVDPRLEVIADAQLARLHPADMPEDIPAQLLGIEHLKRDPSAREPAAIPDLAAGLGVERGADRAPRRLLRQHPGPRPLLAPEQANHWARSSRCS